MVGNSVFYRYSVNSDDFVVLKLVLSILLNISILQALSTRPRLPKLWARTALVKGRINGSESRLWKQKGKKFISTLAK